MSHNQGGQYQQSQQGYQDPRYGHNPTYPGQPQYGAPVQQPQGAPQEDHHSPRAGSFGGGYGAEQRYEQHTYNPRDYAAQQQQQQAYATTTVITASSYNPAAYPPPPSHNTSGPVDPYGYSPAQYSNPTFPPQQSQNSPSPHIGQGQFSPQYSPQPHYQQNYQQYNAPYPYQHGRPHSQSIEAIQMPGPPPASVSPAIQNETWRPSPPPRPSDPNTSSPSPLYPSVSNVSLPSPPPISPGPTPPAHGYMARSDTRNRHPQSRPLPGPPEPDLAPSYFQHRDDSSHNDYSQDELFDQVEQLATGGASPPTHSPSISISQASYEPAGHTGALFSGQSMRGGRNGSIVNGHLSPAPPGRAAEPPSDDSDAEAAQGLAMMHADEANEARMQSGGSQMPFSGLGSQRHSRQPGTASDSDDYGHVDMTSFGGGYDVQMTYGGDPNQLMAGDANGDGYSHPVSSQNSSMRRSNASQSSRGGYDYNVDLIHPFSPLNREAKVDAGGTGGLSEPMAGGRRPSYDEGDEYTLMDGQLPERFPDEPPDISFHQAATTFTPGRPLPPPPAGEMPLLNTDFRGSYPLAPDTYITNSHGQQVPRSTSLLSHSHTPVVSQPLRSKTDAEERRLKQQQYRGSLYTPFESTPASSVVPDLPSLGAKRFLPGKLGAPDFKKCEEPWSLSAILQWLLAVVNPEQYTELKEAEIKEGLVNLFTNKVPTMNIADAETLANRVVQDMYDAETLITTEEWVRIVSAPMSGVIFQLTGSGCYSGTLHNHIIPGRCYSHFCQRTLKKVNLQGIVPKGSDNWAEFYGITEVDVKSKEKKEIELQNNLHEVVSTEEGYMEQLSVLRTLYRDALVRAEPPIIAPKRKDKFLKDVFSRVDAVYFANEEHLLPQLKYRQQEQGPWVLGFSDIFRQWIRKAKTAYLDYAGGFPGANFMVRQEIDRNLDFRNFMTRASKDPRSGRLQWDHFLKSPITRLQRYSLLLSTVYKNMKAESEEKRNLKLALDEIRSVTKECDARVAEMTRKIDLTDLSTKLVLRPGMQKEVNLNLDHFGRELIHRGDLLRMGGNRFTWLDSHALLFDHYLVIAKTLSQGTELGGKVDKYDVSRLPIPMDLLILESANDPAVQKSSYVKGITSVSTVSTGKTDPAALGRIPSNQSPQPGLQHINTNASQNSSQTMTSAVDSRDTDRIMYPFKVKHLGRETYTLFAPNEKARDEWCTKISEAKTKHAAALFAQHAEPFRLRVMADSAFVFDAFGQSGRGNAPVIKGTPVDRAIKELEHQFRDTGRPGPICRARVNCATTFTTPYPGKQMVAVGTDFGVYVSDVDNPRGWAKAIQMSRVTQIAVLEDFNLFLLISDKSLIAYHLDIVLPNERVGPSPTNDSARKAPQKLSGSKDVGFFVTGRMKERTLVFYKKRENLASVFKVLEPIYQKSSEKKRGLFKRGTTEFFREYDDFYIPAECSGINLFHSSLAVSTARGFEVLTLDKKQPWSVPELRAEHVQNIAAHIKDQKALSMLRLSDQEFLLCYSNCAVYVNKHGDVSRSVIMDFVGTAQAAGLHGAYLILFDADFVEIRNANNGRLKQIIAGREIKMLDDGAGWSAKDTQISPQSKETGQSAVVANVPPRTVKFVMQHPEIERTQIVVELLLNENMKES